MVILRTQHKQQKYHLGYKVSPTYLKYTTSSKHKDKYDIRKKKNCYELSNVLSSISDAQRTKKMNGWKKGEKKSEIIDVKEKNICQNKR